MYQERPQAGWSIATDGGIDGIVGALRKVLATGQPLPPERTLAGQLDVKRHKLRLALEILRAHNEIEPASRRRVQSPAAQGEAMIRGTNPIEVIEMRLILEPGLARFAAMRASPEESARISKAAATPPGSPPGQVDLVFHRLVAAGARNGLGADLYTLLRRVGTDARLRVDNPKHGSPSQVAARDAEHQAIAKAIAARDPDAAEHAMRDHLVAVQHRVLAWLQPKPRLVQPG